MKRMSELKADLRGIKCVATEEAFNFLKSEKRKPYIVETPTANYIRVTVDGKRFDYSPTTGAWMPTRDRGKREWNDSASVAEFYAWAVKVAKNIYPPSHKQVTYLEALLRQTGEEMTAGALDSSTNAGEEIGRLKEILNPPPKKAKPRLSLPEYKMYSFVVDRARSGVTLDPSEIAEALGYPLDSVNKAVETLRMKGLIGGVSSYIWPLMTPTSTERGIRA